LVNISCSQKFRIREFSEDRIRKWLCTLPPTVNCIRGTQTACPNLLTIEAWTALPTLNITKWTWQQRSSWYNATCLYQSPFKTILINALHLYYQPYADVNKQLRSYLERLLYHPHTYSTIILCRPQKLGCAGNLADSCVRVSQSCPATVKWRRGERMYRSYSLSTSALDGGEWSAVLYPRGKDPRYPLDRRLGGPRAWLDIDARGKILYLRRGSNTGRPVCSQTLYRATPAHGGCVQQGI
jgi:hypothetical protein